MRNLEEKILRLLEEAGSGGLLQRELYHQLSVPRSTLSTVLRRLEQRGLIVRRREGPLVRIWLSRYAPPDYLGRVRLGLVYALEYPYVPLLLKLSRERRVFDLEVRIFENGIEATLALVRGLIDFCISPLVTQLTIGAVAQNFHIIACAGLGTGALLVRRGVKVRDLEKGRVGSTRLSTMEITLTKILSERGLTPVDIPLHYYSSGHSMARDLQRGVLDYANLWEPYVTQLTTAKVAEVVVDHSELLGLHPCCTLAVRRGVPEEVRTRFLELLEEAVRRTRSGEDLDLVANYFSLTRHLVEKLLSKVLPTSPLDLTSRDMKEFLRRVCYPFGTQEVLTLVKL